MDDSSEATRMIMPQISQKFDREFRQFRHIARDKEKENKESRMQSVKLIETEEKLSLLERTVAAKDDEIEKLRKREETANVKLDEVREEKVVLQRELDECRRLLENKDEDLKVHHEKLLLDSYRAALSKYRTWFEFSQHQMEAMKNQLESAGKWTDEARFKIYFAYQSIAPIMVTDDEVSDLAFGSILDYKGIENIEGISCAPFSSRFLNGSTQTEDSAFSKESSLYYSMDLSGNTSANEESTVRRESSTIPTLTLEETMFSEFKDRIQKLETENIKLKEQLYIINHKAKRIPLIEEEKHSLESRLNVLSRQNQNLLNEIETLKDSIRNEVFTDMAGPAKRASAQEIIRNIMEEKKKNDQLHVRIRALEEGELRHLEMIQQAESEVEHLQKELSETREEAQTDIENLKKEMSEAREKARREIESLREQLTQPTELQQSTSTEGSSDTSKALSSAETRRISEFFKQKYQAEIEDLRKKLRKHENISISDTTQIVRFRRFNPLDDAHEEYLMKQAVAAASTKRRKLDSTTEQNSDDTLEADISANESISYQNLRSQLRTVENKVQETLNVNTELLKKASQYRELVRDLLGYQIKMRNEEDVEVESVYDTGNNFHFQRDPMSHAIGILENEYTGRWTDQMREYLGMYHSIPAFLAAVNLTLQRRADDSTTQATFSVVHED